jgi:hypothetical protein
MIRIVIESPFGSRTDGTRASPDELARNVVYAQRAMLDSLKRGEAPFLSHLLYPQVLVDSTPAERELGMRAGFAWGRVADAIIVYADYGITPGMIEGIKRYQPHIPASRLIGPNP